MSNIFETNLRQYDYEIVCGGISNKEYPSYFDLPRKAKIKNQKFNKKEILACGACAIATVAEHIWGKEFSEGFAYSKFRSDTHNTPGLYLTIALDMWRKIGIVPLSDFGSLEEMPTIKELVEKFPELLEKARDYKIGGYASLNYAMKEKKDLAIKDALSKPDGIGLIASSSTYFGAGHAFVITGWNDENNTYIYQNSYGISFGDNGKGEIPKSKVDAVFAVFAEEFELPFKDVDKDRWSYKNIRNLYLSGVINGKTSDTLDPAGYIAREEVFAIADRILEKVDEKLIRIYEQINERIVK